MFEPGPQAQRPSPRSVPRAGPASPLVVPDVTARGPRAWRPALLADRLSQLSLGCLESVVAPGSDSGRWVRVRPSSPPRSQHSPGRAGAVPVRSGPACSTRQVSEGLRTPSLRAEVDEEQHVSSTRLGLCSAEERREELRRRHCRPRRSLRRCAAVPPTYASGTSTVAPAATRGPSPPVGRSLLARRVDEGYVASDHACGTGSRRRLRW
jgi:hypothetical protein